ncbi:MAG TPA: NAD(P)/FAD-dependent oxidoreductase [Myxococcota bacterium]|nr:NAD(P)/FAD-dependent oxidoreductase [Myxococcota bacterium]
MGDAVEVVIVGAGFGGLCAAIRLQAEGRTFVLLEKGEEIGGTWRDNTYPGAACDVQSHLYSLSFEPHAGWTRRYAGWQEIRDYLHLIAERRGLRRHLRLRTAATAARWTGEGWIVQTSSGDALSCRALVLAAGPLHVPHVPALRGLDTFAGPVMHSARWDHRVELDGRDVVSIGTGASAIQYVPEVARRAGRLTVVQRTPAWVIPRDDRPYPAVARAAFERVPLLRAAHRASLYLRNEARVVGLRYPALAERAERLLRRHIRAEVRDAAVAQALTPTYRLGCKRALLSNDWYPTFNRPNVRLVTSAIDHVERDGVVTVDGERHPADVLLLGTGFEVDPRRYMSGFAVEGVGGRALLDAWRDLPAAWRGTLVPGFPNLFLLLGPNTGLGHNSVLLMIEAQVEWALRALRRADAAGRRAVDVRPDELTRYNRELQDGLRGTAWATGCQSWYLTDDGVNYSIWPWSTLAFIRMMRTPGDVQLI